MYLFIHSFFLAFFELSGSVIWYLSLIWGKVASNITSFPFCLSPPSGISIMLFYTFCSFPIALGYSLLFSLFLFLVFSFRNLNCHVFKLRDSFISYVQSTDEPIKDILHFYYSVFNPWCFFFFLLRILIFSLILFICSCTLTTFSIKAFSILVIVFLNYQSAFQLNIIGYTKRQKQVFNNVMSRGEFYSPMIRSCLSSQMMNFITALLSLLLPLR